MRLAVIEQREIEMLVAQPVQGTNIGVFLVFQNRKRQL